MLIGARGRNKVKKEKEMSIITFCDCKTDIKKRFKNDKRIAYCLKIFERT
jgi:hypothetical protein